MEKREARDRSSRPSSRRSTSLQTSFQHLKLQVTVSKNLQEFTLEEDEGLEKKEQEVEVSKALEGDPINRANYLVERWKMSDRVGK